MFVFSRFKPTKKTHRQEHLRKGDNLIYAKITHNRLQYLDCVLTSENQKEESGKLTPGTCNILATCGK